MIVMKFGGAALADRHGLATAAKIVAGEERDRVVVCSAMQGVTDSLEAWLATLDELGAQRLLADLRARHDLPLDAVGQAELDDALQHLERLVFGATYTGECTPRIWDAVMSHGERLAAIAMASALRAQGVEAYSIDAGQAGLRTHGPFGNARPDLDAIRASLPDALQGPGVPVMTGFYGVDSDGHPTLFGRGGSDYVASLVAYGLQAAEVQLWKAVPGFMTGDPAEVSGARPVPELGYDEAAELAHFGAKVLHPRCVEPVEALGIPIRVCDVQRPDSAGTLIDDHAGRPPALVRACAVMHGLTILKLNGPGMAYTSGVALRVFEALAGINVLNMSTSQATFALTVSARDQARALEALDALVGGVIQSVEALPDRSLVCVVGRGLGETPGSAAKILAAVSGAGVNVEMISLGASQFAIDFMVQHDQAAAALNAIHGAFLEAP